MKNAYDLLVIVFVIISLSCICMAADFKPTKVKVTATAYCPCSICCGQHADGLTATGRDASKPGVAVDPTQFALGSRFDIPGYNRNNGNWILADDTGKDIKGECIDVRFANHEEAVKWGRKTLTVRIWTQK